MKMERRITKELLFSVGLLGEEDEHLRPTGSSSNELVDGTTNKEPSHVNVHVEALQPPEEMKKDNDNAHQQIQKLEEHYIEAVDESTSKRKQGEKSNENEERSQEIPSNDLVDPSLPTLQRNSRYQPTPGAVSVTLLQPSSSIRQIDQEALDEEQPPEMDLIEAELVPDKEEKANDSPLAVAIASPWMETKWKRIAIGAVIILLILVVVVLVATLSSSNPPDTFGVGVRGNATDTSDDEPLTPKHKLVQLGNTIIGPAPFDRFGAPLALSRDGTILAAGARNNGNMGVDSGLVRVFKFSQSISSNRTIWRQMGNAIGGQAPQDEFGYSGMAMSMNGTRLAVGAPFHNASISNASGLVLHNAGNIRIFDITADKSSWIQVGPSLNGIAAGDLFGRAVAVSFDGSIVAGAAYESSENGQYSGHVRVFQQMVSGAGSSEPHWVQMGNTILGRSAFDRLGRSLAMSSGGLRIAAGATQFEGEGPGYVQVYDFNGTKWNQIGQDVWGDNDQDVFGRDVALSADGSIMACGANLASGNGDESGLVRVFRLVTMGDSVDVWEKMGQSILGTSGGDGLGLTVALSSDGSRVAVGASQKKTGVGYVRIFDYDEDMNEWNQVGFDLNGIEHLEKFGTDIQLSASGNILAVGSIGSDANGDDSGHAIVFDLDSSFG